MYVAPDYVVFFGLRTIFSLVGISLIVIGLWKVLKRWDYEGAAAYERAAGISEVDNDYKAVEDGNITHSDGSGGQIKVSSQDSNDVPKGEDVVVVPLGELEDAYRPPAMMSAGFATWAVSFIFTPEGLFQAYASWNIVTFALLLLMDYFIAYPLRNAIIKRNDLLRKKLMATIVLIGFWVMFSVMLDDRIQAPLYFCAFGALFCFIAFHIIRRTMRMGATWDLQGKPRSSIYTQSLGPLFLLFGLFLFWVGSNAVAVANFTRSFPIYTSARAALVFISAFVIILPSLIALDFAFDEGAEADGLYLTGKVLNARIKDSFLGREPFERFSIAFAVLGRVFETPYPFIFGWFMFSLCSFLPFDDGFNFQRLSAFLLANACGILYGLKVLPALWHADSSYKLWIIAYYILFILLATAIGFDGSIPLIFSMVGTILIAGGHYVDMLERKRGRYWLHNKTENPKPTNFGIGHPLFIVGWILFCLAMAVPM